MFIEPIKEDTAAISKHFVKMRNLEVLSLKWTIYENLNAQKMSIFQYVIEQASKYILSGVTSRLKQLGGYLNACELCRSCI